MDEVAARASASKMTLYKHFGDKESLFAAVVESTIETFDDPFFEAIDALASAGDLEEHLRHLGRQLMRLTTRPRVLQLRRLVIGESARFPDLGRWAAERGPQRAMDALAAAFDDLVARGKLRVADVRLAAANYSYLIISIPVNAAMFTGADEPFAAHELDRFVDEGVRVFLAAYGTDGSER